MSLPRRFSPDEDEPPAGVMQPDDAVRSTDEDALVSKLSAVALGYLDDPFVPLFTKSPRSALSSARIPGTRARRPPLINVGTHHRTWAVDRLVRAFLLDGVGGKNDGDSKGRKGKQIVSLGAGSDTRFWRLMSENVANIAKYIEVDFPHNTSAKARKISPNKVLSSACFPKEQAGLSGAETGSMSGYNAGESAGATLAGKPIVSKGGTMLETPLYVLIPLDLRDESIKNDSNPDDPCPVLSTFLLPHLDPTLPTLFIAECLFCYLPPATSHSILRWFSSTFTSTMGIMYEMHGLEDNFGKVMRRNLGSRGIRLLGAEAGSPGEQGERFGLAGFEEGRGVSLKEVRREKIPKEELRRISALEMLDEVEELDLVLDHYSVAWGWSGIEGDITL